MDVYTAKAIAGTDGKPKERRRSSLTKALSGSFTIPRGGFSKSGSKKKVSVTDEIRLMGSSLPNPITLMRWLLFKRGALTSVACEFGGFFRTAKEHSHPDLQVRFIAARAMSADGISTLEKLGAGDKFYSGYTTQIIAARPKSSGRVGTPIHN